MSGIRLRCRPGLALVVLGLALTGCGSNKQRADWPATGPTHKQLLADVGEWVKAYTKDNKKPPSRPADINSYEPTFPDAHRGITTKVIEYQWGAGFNSEGEAGNTVLAYEKDVETKGGFVLMQNGKLKEMSPDQFKAAPKAAKGGRFEAFPARP